jgi:hypothetical protein
MLTVWRAHCFQVDAKLDSFLQHVARKSCGEGAADDEVKARLSTLYDALTAIDALGVEGAQPVDEEEVRHAVSCRANMARFAVKGQWRMPLSGRQRSLPTAAHLRPACGVFLRAWS